MLRRSHVVALILMMSSGCASNTADIANQDAIPNSATAIAVGRPLLVASNGGYDPPDIAWYAELNGDIWTVSYGIPVEVVGGSFFVELSKKDGRIIRFYLTQ